MSITPDTPAAASQGEVQHGSNLSGNYRPLRVSSQCNSTTPIGIKGEIIDWRSLSRQPLVLTHTIQLIMQKLMTSKEAHLNIKAVINSLEALRVLVQENQCATILPYSFCRREYLMGLFKIYRILDDSMKRKLIIATARSRQKPPAVKLVSQLCSNIFSDLDSQGMFKIT